MWSTGQLLFREPWSTGHLSSDIVVAGQVERELHRVAASIIARAFLWTGVYVVSFYYVSTHHLPSTQQALFPPPQLGLVVSRFDGYPSRR